MEVSVRYQINSHRPAYGKCTCVCTSLRPAEGNSMIHLAAMSKSPCGISTHSPVIKQRL